MDYSTILNWIDCYADKDCLCSILGWTFHLQLLVRTPIGCDWNSVAIGCPRDLRADLTDSETSDVILVSCATLWASARRAWHFFDEFWFLWSLSRFPTQSSNYFSVEAVVYSLFVYSTSLRFISLNIHCIEYHRVYMRATATVEKRN